MKGLPPALRKALKDASRKRSSAVFSPSGALLDEKQHKYLAIRTKCLYGHPHDSRKEAMWCLKLHELQKEGKIRNLSVSPIYELRVNGQVICKHEPDFDYEITPDRGTPFNNLTVKVVVVDVKGEWEGALLPVWKIKHKLFQACYPEIEYKVV